MRIETASQRAADTDITTSTTMGKGHMKGLRRNEAAVRRTLSLLACTAATLLLADCKELDRNRGLNPVIQAGDVEIASQNQVRILNALAIDYNVSNSRSSYWYDVSVAGFNYVDDECRVYFNDLFFLNREKDEIKTGLAAAGATAAAIMGVTGASTKSIAIVAQAFGLGAISTDLVAGTFLYQVPPATALGFVKELQLAYRNGIADRKAMINSPSTSYHAIQDYLSLCLPPTIEAKIAEHVASARATPDPVTGAGPSFGLNVVTVPQVTRADIKAAILANADTVLPNAKAKQPAPKGPTVLTDAEAAMLTSEIKDLQAALCVPQDGNLGQKGSKTRNALLQALTLLKDPRLPPSAAITDKTFNTFLRNQYVQPRLDDPKLADKCGKNDFSVN
ncbi:hypothetical protein [Bradyrhizobium cosmicum]|uniref:Uncharacterized protein n=1 Tax=Bradyrhizobium cosmicum TaxID=1404864 RepID=A0AAI8MEN6_9BRAD|nr:hypothetical protein [Bradyrhizobium cosmicum]BAL76830.1 hypothetical protein S23_36310 [Bradyrhizobium cosmicum]